MRRTQSGVSFLGLVMGLVVLIIVALFAMKLAPSYIEFRSAKKAIDAIAQEKQGGSPADIRRAFESRSAVDDINSIKAEDLEITKEGGEAVVTATWSVKVPIIYNFSACLDFSTTTAK